MQHLRWLLLPFSLIYGFVVTIRNWLYDAGFFNCRSFEIPVICIGNLEVGGAGKSPMTEHLIALLKDDHKVATLSRGYGRETEGFLEVSVSSTASQVGDEPLQFKRKFPGVTVAVCEKRVVGIEKLQPKHDVIVLDDAYQHRAVKAGLNILLFDYGNLQKPQFVLPAGNLREPFSGRWRADVMVVTKCPADIDEDDMTRCYNKLTPLNTQPLFFSSIGYQPLKVLNGNVDVMEIDAETTVYLLTGIANPAPLLSYISGYTSRIVHHKYPDHHQFTTKNITKLANDFEACKSAKKLVITTEKDAQRLTLDVLKNLPVYVQPIGVRILNQAQPQFDEIITNYVRKH